MAIFLTVVFEHADNIAYENALNLVLNASDLECTTKVVFYQDFLASLDEVKIKKFKQLKLYDVPSFIFNINQEEGRKNINEGLDFIQAVDGAQLHAIYEDSEHILSV